MHEKKQEKKKCSRVGRKQQAIKDQKTFELKYKMYHKIRGKLERDPPKQIMAQSQFRQGWTGS